MAAFATIAVLTLHRGGVQPRLDRRSDRVLTGEQVPRSSSDHAYIALEVVKVIGLILLGIILLTG